MALLGADPSFHKQDNFYDNQTPLRENLIAVHIFVHQFLNLPIHPMLSAMLYVLDIYAIK